MFKLTNNKVFLKSNWLRLTSANYVVNSSILEKHIPSGTELEFHKGKCYVSLVAFLYTETRLLNVRVPFHNTFEEINLRFYVKREVSPGVWRSEVAFTKLFFPKIALTLVAKYIYKENYETLAMRHFWKDEGEFISTNYGLYKKKWHNFEVKSTLKSYNIVKDSNEFFFSKQYWGTSQIDKNSCTIYEIKHPDWRVYKVNDWNISFDFESVFGEEFKCLMRLKPESVYVYDGSEVIVNKKKII